MLRSNFFLKISFITLLLKILFIFSIEAQADSNLNGKWVKISEGPEVFEGIETEILLNNGNYEEYNNNVLTTRGTYITNNGEYIDQATHVFGEGINILLDWPNLFESKLYTMEEFFILIKPIFLEYGLAEEYNNFVERWSSPQTTYYSIQDDILIMTSTVYGEKVVNIYRKR